MKNWFPLFSVLVVVFLIPLQVWSQDVTVTVGTGTTTTNISPINSYYRHSWTECIYQASDIAEDGYIYRLAWECSDAYSFFMNTMEIYMGTTSNTTHANNTSWLPLDQLTLVYSGVSVNIPNSTGWLYFDLDDAFEYSSDENLVIVVAKTAPSWTSSLRFYATSSNNAVLYRRSDSSTDYANHPGTANGTLSDALANIKLFFASVSCPSARNITISDVTTESALATWTGDPSNTSWLVGWGLTETAAQTNVITVQDTFVVLDNLSSESQYYFSVQSVCDTIANGHWKTTNFRTPCAGNYVSGGCFDLTNLSNPGITCKYGDFYDPYYYTGIAQNRHTVVTQLQYDPNTNYTLPTIPDCRDYSVRLGNDGTGAQAESISLDYMVDTTQADLILLQYAVVMQDPGHDPEDQPRFTMEILNSANQLIDPGCGYDDFVASSGLGWSSFGGVIWNEWTTVGMDISAYHGQNVKVRMTTYDCEQGGHFGYAYFLLDCGSKRMKSDFCGLDTVRTFTAPAGFRYEWYWESNPDSIISLDRSVTFSEDHNERIFCKVTSLSKDSCYFRIYGSLEPRYPIADFSTTIDNCTRMCVFHNESVVSADGITPNSNFEPCDNALWDFGDGTVSQQYNPTHTYSSPGTYQVMLVSGLHDFSCTDTAFYTITLLPNYTYIDSSVCNSCTWNGAVYTQSGTYTYTTQSTSGCDSTVVLNLQVNSSPTVSISGPTILCADSSVVLTTDSAYSYLWSTGDTTQSISVTEAGTYSLTITNEFGCPAEASHQVTSMDNPIMSVTVPEMCAGGSYTLSVGHQDNNNIHLGHGETTLSLTETIYLPDGVYCDPFGCSYRSPLTFTAYADDATIQSAEDIYYVRLNMEHSYIGDLYINITCPNGQKADLLKYSGSGLSNCTSQIPNSSRGWASGSNMPEYTYLGVAYDYDVASCDATAFGNEPGVGWNYCWSNNTTQGYGYAQGNDGLIYRYGNSHNNIVDSSNVAAGTQFYHPDDSFSNLIGCPLNGDWYIEVQDGWSQDNGYIFGWELALSSEALPNIDFELDHSTASGPWVTTISDSLFQITPPAGLSHDTTIAYTFTVYDTGGCAYDTTVYITVHAIPHTEIDTAVCDVLTYGGISYTVAGQYTQTYTNVFGCDSILTLNLNILPPTDSTLVVTVVENNLPYQLNGSPYTTSGTYTQHLDNAAGCDSLLTLVLTVLYNVTNAVDTTVCTANLPITWHGHTYTAAGTHTNVLTASNGVDSTVTYTLYVDELSASVGNVTHVVCYGAATGAATVTVTGGQSPLSYQWTTAAGTGISTTTSVSGCVAGNYTFTVTDQLGCTVTVPVTVNTLNDSMQPGTIASDQEVCSGNEIEAFTGTSAVGGDNSAYQWQISTNNTDWTPALGNNTGQNYSYPNLSSESFWLRRAWISQSCGTVYSNTVMLTVLPVTHDTITVDVCQNNDYQGYGFEVPASEIEQPGEYVFERIQTTGPCDTFFVLLLTVHPVYSTDISDEICEGGGYFAHGFNIPAPATIDVEFLSQTLNLQSVHGCDSTVHLELSVTDTAIRIIPLTTDFCETMSAELMVETSMADYVWSTGEQAPTITVTQPGIYSVTASQGVCQATAHIRVENCQNELYLPNAITPSKGDGLNDYFSIPAYNQLGMDKFEISIINRWGEQVFYSTDKNFRWNGEYRGQIHQEAIYNYIIHYTDLTGKPHKVTGRITVL